MSAWKAGKILWFDDLTGEGLVIDSAGKTYYVHEAAIVKNRPSQKKSSVTLPANSQVKFTLYSNGYISQVDRIKPI